MDVAHDYYPCEEPSLVQTLTLASFLVFLNVARIVCDYLANVGILGELFIGLVYGAPLANILTERWQATFTAVGYIGLIIVVLEGGLSNNLALARRNFAMSSLVALTGLVTPILLSLVLLHLAFGFTLLQAFTAGAALSTTSLGTTFSVISQAGFGETRLGAVLTSAAVADDVVGLVLLQVVVSLGSATSDDESPRDQAAALGWTIGRPLLASLAMLVVSWPLLKWVISPMYTWMSRKALPRLVSAEQVYAYNLVVALIVASAYVAVSSLSGTSILLGAFIAGLVLCSLGSSLKTLSPESPDFLATYKRYIHPVQSHVLRPLFFASIGFAIHVKSLFDGQTVWQGIVYSAVCLMAKLVCGLFVVIDYYWSKWRQMSKATQMAAVTPAKSRSAADKPNNSDAAEPNTCRAEPTTQSDNDDSIASVTPTFPPFTAVKSTRMPSLLPVSTLLGSAMVARGEISLLIANVARENSPELMPNELFYLTIWSILVCTVIVPVVVGIIVKRMGRKGSMLPPEWGPQSRIRNDSSTPQGRGTHRHRPDSGTNTQ